MPEETVRLKGEIVRDVIRGRELVERFADRLHGLLGFRPYPGTLNVRVEQPVDIEDFETKRLEHILFDGSVWIDARLAPIKLTFRDKTVDAWIIVDERSLHEEDVLEVIHKDRLTETTGLKLGDRVTVELTKRRRTLKSRFKKAMRPLFPKSPRIVK